VFKDAKEYARAYDVCQRVGKPLLCMCYIICTSRIDFIASGIQGGLMGGRGAREAPPTKFLHLEKRVTYLGGFSKYGFFADGFLFPVKELWLLTNLGH
jgi:hypothetical protein